jgi:hypothetical protein
MYLVQESEMLFHRRYLTIQIENLSHGRYLPVEAVAVATYRKGKHPGTLWRIQYHRNPIPRELEFGTVKLEVLCCVHKL